ncbi:MAG: hypothetical protein ACLP0J_09695 [Solirubrobacteraceae bacterium]
MFEEPSTGWPTTMTQNSELTPSDPGGDPGSTLGIGGVAISGSTIVGGPGSDSGSASSGAVYEFTEPTGGWPATMTQTQELLLTTPEHGSGFGFGVGVSGTTAVVGANNAPPSGAAFVFGPETNTTTTTTTTTTTPAPTTTTTTTTTTATPTTSTVGAGASGHASVSGDSASVKATCAGAATTSCKLTYSLTSRETVENGKPVAVAASKKIKRTTKTVTIGSAALLLTGGRAHTVKLTLNATGKALLAKFRTLPADLTVTQTQATGAAKVISTQKVTFHAPKAKKNKK